MIAEIFGKISSQGTNLTERLEDQLTGNFFGALRYIPYNAGLKRILTSCVYPPRLSDFFRVPNKSEWHNDIIFWKREVEGEPDILLKFDESLICIEVKYFSGLSSDDDVSNDASVNQLARQWKMLKRLAGGKQKFLLLWGDESYCHSIYADVLKKRQLVDGNFFGYITWQKVLAELRCITDVNAFEQIVINDLIDLLVKKNFDSFNGFDFKPVAISADLFWPFICSDTEQFDFSFTCEKVRGLHYEFGREHSQRV